MKKLLAKILLALLLVLTLVPAVEISNLPLHKQITATKCLAANIFYEARGETQEGMKAVAAVTLNRASSKLYPSGVCSVVFQRKQFSWTHQQSFKDIQKVLQGDTSDLNQKDRQAYLQVVIVAQKPSKELTAVLPKGSLWYHASYVKPLWAKGMQKVKRVGVHIFYKKVPKK